jgi:hypothetical protein
MSEADILARSLLAVGALPGIRLSRNNTGAAMDRTGRLVRYGLFQPGGSDVIGFKSVIITREMVGRPAAIFTAMEAKTEGGRFRPGQREFLQMVRDAGGIAGVIRSPEDALNLVGSVIAD